MRKTYKLSGNPLNALDMFKAAIIHAQWTGIGFDWEHVTVKITETSIKSSHQIESTADIKARVEYTGGKRILKGRCVFRRWNRVKGLGMPITVQVWDGAETKIFTYLDAIGNNIRLKPAA